mmetsp:Transcript_67/g.188  ORF Transcript_67/g.188 Transcript_67/m.188 type:complete len:205 (+) Transcript_67:388-1002(+)
MFIAHDPLARKDRQVSTQTRTLLMIASTVSASRPTPISVATKDLFKSVTELTLMRSPFKVAPLPCTAAKVSPVIGLSTTPSTGILCTVSPIDTHENGYPCTKFVVPSSGSTNHVGASPIVGNTPLAAATDSSPTKSCSGNAACNLRKIRSSHFLSVAVTKSHSPLYSTSRSTNHAAFISSPASDAAATASNKHESKSSEGDMLP